jgi:hypothetical protein
METAQEHGCKLCHGMKRQIAGDIGINHSEGGRSVALKDLLCLYLASRPVYDYCQCMITLDASASLSCN